MGLTAFLFYHTMFFSFNLIIMYDWNTCWLLYCLLRSQGHSYYLFNMFHFRKISFLTDFKAEICESVVWRQRNSCPCLHFCRYEYKIGIFPRVLIQLGELLESCKDGFLTPSVPLHANCLHFPHVLIIVHKQSQALAAPWNAI